MTQQLAVAGLTNLPPSRNSQEGVALRQRHAANLLPRVCDEVAQDVDLAKHINTPQFRDFAAPFFVDRLGKITSDRDPIDIDVFKHTFFRTSVATFHLTMRERCGAPDERHNHNYVYDSDGGRVALTARGCYNMLAGGGSNRSRAYREVVARITDEVVRFAAAQQQQLEEAKRALQATKEHTSTCDRVLQATIEAVVTVDESVDLEASSRRVAAHVSNNLLSKVIGNTTADGSRAASHKKIRKSIESSNDEKPMHRKKKVKVEGAAGQGPTYTDVIVPMKDPVKKDLDGPAADMVNLLTQQAVVQVRQIQRDPAATNAMQATVVHTPEHEKTKGKSKGELVPAKTVLRKTTDVIMNLRLRNKNGESFSLNDKANMIMAMNDFEPPVADPGQAIVATEHLRLSQIRVNKVGVLAIGA